MHWMDRIGLAVTTQPRLYERVFSAGWGEQLGEAIDLVRSVPPVEPVVGVESLPARYVDGARHLQLRFPSPIDLLPAESHLAHVHLIEPRNADRAVVMMAAFNDHGPDTRLALAGPLLSRGVAVAILENPYYGLRRPLGGQPMSTAADLLVMGAAAVAEGRMVLELLSDMGYGTLGVSGYSMGANIAAFVAAASSRPVACAALAASHSPGPVFTRGALAAAVDWDALGGFESARPRLGEVLGEATVLRHPAPPHTEAALVVGAEADGYIPRDATEDLARHWPGSGLRFIPGGHASLLIRSKATLSALILESLDRLTAWRQGASTLTS